MSDLDKKQGRVYIAESRVDIRGVIRDAVKDIGFTDIKSASSLKEIIDLLEVDETPPTWIISALMPNDPVNGLHLLAVCIKAQKLHNCRISFILDREEKECLRKGFELGLFSYHFKPFTKMTLVKEFVELMARASKDGDSHCLTAASYLRAFLIDEGNYEDVIKFEEFLITLYPQNGSLLLNLAEAQHLAGRHDEALKTITQAKHLDPQVAKAAKQLEDMVCSELPEGRKEGTESFANAFSLQTVVIIDSDEAARRQVHATMTTLGLPEIHEFADGEQASEWIMTNPQRISLIVTEWRLPKLGAPALVQRMRNKGIEAPVIVFSGLVKTTDLSLLRELGIAQVIEKPLDKDLMLPVLMATIRQERFPTEYRVLERHIKNAIMTKKLDEADALFSRLESSKTAPDHSKKIMRAELLLARGDYETARSCLFDALKANRDTLQTLNLLGKVYMKMRCFTDAIKCLNKAQEISSQNLERLCLLAEAKAETGDTQGALDTLESAKVVDAGNPQITETALKVALSSGDAAKAKSLAATIESFTEVVSFMNNRAISLTKQSELKEAIKLYETALASLPPSEERLRATICYNLTLAHIRSGSMDKALIQIKRCLEQRVSTVAAKAESIKVRLEQAIAKGQVLKLAAQDEKAATGSVGGVEQRKAVEPSSLVPSIVAIDLKPGELCCHQVYYAPVPPEWVVTLLAKPPRLVNAGPDVKTTSTKAS